MLYNLATLSKPRVRLAEEFNFNLLSDADLNLHTILNETNKLTIYQYTLK